MAESAVSFVLNGLYQLLKEEVNVQKSVHAQFVEIKDELESIQAFIKDADRRAAAAAAADDEGDTNQSIKVWVKQVREASFHIEDAIDEYLTYAAQESHHHGCKASIQKIGHLIKTLKPRSRIASHIQDLKLSVHKIKERSERYKLQSLPDEQGTRDDRRGTKPSFKWRDPRMGSLFIEEAEVVGFEYPRDQLVDWLTNEATPMRTVISVVGMGGLGKTTLASNVFRTNAVKDRFDCRAFITVSQTYSLESLLKEMVKQFFQDNNESLPQGFNTMDHMALVTEARRYLQEKRYVVVFDDVWKVDFWDEIQLPMIDNNIGSRIIITTRNLEVANYCKKSSHVKVHMLQPMPPNKAWELFCKKAFQFDFDGICPPELEDLSHEIVQKCEGLPLAIVAIGGLLLTKDKTVLEWKRLRQNLSSELDRNPHLASLTRILALSYDDLPYYLKSCILYFGIYPEDYSIRCTRMFRQWIAEGFVIDEENKPLEEVAKEYLTELVNRSLVQVSKVNYEGRPSSSRIHDLLREMMCRKMKDLSFCRVVHEDSQHIHDTTTRRLSIATSSSDVLMSIEQSNMRSMYMFEAGKLPEHFLSMFFAKFKLLKVLDLEGASVDYVPNPLGNIFHLKFLSLRNTKVKDLPKSIGKLQNLETLDLKETPVHGLPRDINKLLKLRHLIVCYRKKDSFNEMDGETGVQVKEGIGCLTFLQTLYHVKADQGGLDLIAELRKLRQLRKLGLKKVRREYGKALCDSLQEMNRLVSLSISATTEDEIIDLHLISSPPQQLQRLHLFGRLETLPEWVSRLHCLVRLSIRFSKLTNDPLNLLKDLPNLMRLAVGSDAYDGDALHFEAGFPKLKRLYIARLKHLNSIVIDKGALPVLEIIRMSNMPQLKEIPSDFHLLKNVGTLYLNSMPREFCQSIDPDNGPKYWVIKHVHIVSIIEWVGPGRFDYSHQTIRHSRNI